MKKLIEVTEGLYILPHHVSAVRMVDEDSCTVWLGGQSAVTDGFLVNRPAEEIADEINDALEAEEIGKARLMVETAQAAK